MGIVVGMSKKFSSFLSKSGLGRSLVAGGGPASGFFLQAAAGPGVAGFEALAQDRDLVSAFAAAEPSEDMPSARRDVIFRGSKYGEPAEGLPREVFAPSCVSLFPQAAAGSGAAGFEAAGLDRDLVSAYAAAEPLGVMRSAGIDVILRGPKHGEPAEGLPGEVFACMHWDLLLFFSLYSTSAPDGVCPGRGDDLKQSRSMFE